MFHRVSPPSLYCWVFVISYLYDYLLVLYLNMYLKFCIQQQIICSICFTIPLCDIYTLWYLTCCFFSNISDIMFIFVCIKNHTNLPLKSEAVDQVKPFVWSRVVLCVISTNCSVQSDLTDKVNFSRKHSLFNACLLVNHHFMIIWIHLHNLTDLKTVRSMTSVQSSCHFLTFWLMIVVNATNSIISVLRFCIWLDLLISKILY